MVFKLFQKKKNAERRVLFFLERGATKERDSGRERERERERKGKKREQREKEKVRKRVTRGMMES